MGTFIAVVSFSPENDLPQMNTVIALALAAMQVVTGIAWFIAVRPRRERARG